MVVLLALMVVEAQQSAVQAVAEVSIQMVRQELQAKAMPAEV